MMHPAVETSMVTSKSICAWLSFSLIKLSPCPMPDITLTAEMLLQVLSASADHMLEHWQ